VVQIWCVHLYVTPCKNIGHSVGDYYWNHYSNQGLSGYTNQRLYENLEIAKQDCIEFSTTCAGVTKEQNGYTLRRELIFVSELGSETWVKEKAFPNHTFKSKAF